MQSEPKALFEGVTITRINNDNEVERIVLHVPNCDDVAIARDRRSALWAFFDVLMDAPLPNGGPLQ